MKKLLNACIFVLLLGFSATLNGQELSRKLRYERMTFDNRYFIGSHQVSSQEFMEHLNQNKDLGKAFKVGRNLQVAGEFIGSIGAFCFGWDLGARIAGAKGNPALLLGGGGVMISGLIMSYAGNSKVKKALNLHNRKNVEISLVPVSNGIGLCLNF